MQVNLFLNSNKQKVMQNNLQSLAWYGFRNKDLKTDTISFGAKDICSPKNFQIKTLPNLYCPMCGVIMLREEDVKKIANDLGSKKGKSLISALDRLSYTQTSDFKEAPNGVFRAEKKPIVDIYKNLAKKHPDKDLLELTQLHAKKCVSELIKNQLQIVDELKEFIEKNIPSEKQEEIWEVILDYEERIKGESKEGFYRKDFIDNIVGVVDDEYKAQVKEIALKLPNSKNDINSFFVKHAKKANDAIDIASRLLEDSIATVEHIVPISAKGGNRLSNYLCDCRYCNNSRSSTPFEIWSKNLPEGLESRLQEYLQIVQDNTEEGKLEAKYEDYIKDIIETIKEATNGKIRLALPETTDPIRLNKIILDRMSEVQSSQAQNDSLNKTALRLAQEIARLKSYQFYDEVYEYFALETKLEEFDKMLAEIKDIGSLGHRTVIAQKEALIAQKNQMKDRRKEVLTRISLLAPTAKKIEELLAQKEKNEKNKIAVEKYTKTVIGLESTIKELEEENALISSTGEFSEKDLQNYERYLYCKKILLSTQRVLQAQDYRKLKLPANDAKEIFNYANQALMFEIEALENLPVVKYKTNCANIEKMKEQLAKENLRARQADIVLVDELEKEIIEECKGKTIKEFMEEYNALKEEAQTIEGIRTIKQKIQKLNKINDLISSNSAILEKLKECTNMTNTQYNSLVVQLCFDIFKS